MRVLITNLVLANYSGSEIVAELLAVSLRRSGHEPSLFAPVVGDQAIAMRERGFSVVDRIGALSETPDVIHAQHVTPALIAMSRFPNTPVVYTCHSPFFTIEAPLPHPQIRTVVAVDETCAIKCREQGIEESALTIIPNAVDLGRFKRRDPLPDRPARALLLTKTSEQREAVRAACAEAGILLDEIGPASGNVVTDLEDRLGQYHIVFATARMALEAAVVGCAVVVCDGRGFAGMLTRAKVDDWRRYNLGIGLLIEKTTVDNLRASIAQYDAADATAVCERLREQAGTEPFVESYLDLYRDAIDSPAADPEAVALGNARWAEEFSVTPTPRLWGAISSELHLVSPDPKPDLSDRLDTLAEKMDAGFARMEERLDTIHGREQAGFMQWLRKAFQGKG